jgi:hypothetical protein
MSTINMPKTVPFLPGFQFTNPDKLNHHKTQQFGLKDQTSNFSLYFLVLEKTNFIQETLSGPLLE